MVTNAAHILAAATETQRQAFELAGLPAGWLLTVFALLIAAACMLVVRLYLREARAGAGLGLRLGLAVVRCVVVLLLAGIWLEPVLATYLVRTVTARVIVLVDSSQSMEVADLPAARTATQSAARSNEFSPRIERVADVLTDDGGAWLRRLAADNAVALYRFGETTAALPTFTASAEEANQAPAQTQPGGGVATPAPATPTALRAALVDDAEPATNLGQALSRALQDAGDSPIAAMIVLSDGGVNEGVPIDDLGPYLRQAGAPLFAVGVGAPREPVNVRVTLLDGPESVPRGDPLELRVSVALAGEDEATFSVDLYVATEPDEVDSQRATGDASLGVLLKSQEVRLSQENPTTELTFQVPADVAGTFVYTARVNPLPREAVLNDNQRQLRVRVLDEPLRVLLVSGAPSYQYRMITPLLERDRTINLSCWLQSADATSVRDGNTIITELPRTPEDLFAYDAVLLLDPDPRELDAAWAVLVRRFVDEFGGGVLLAAGPHFTTRFTSDPRLAELVNIFPVAFDPEAEVRLGELGAYRTTPLALRLADDALASPLIDLESTPQRSRALWAALPGVYWYLPVLRPKPAASVLLTQGRATPGLDADSVLGPPPLLATQPFGGGRTVYLGFDGTWRWRSTAEVYFDRFWVRMVRYLGQARREGQSRRGTLVIDRPQVSVGEAVKIEARVLDERYLPWQADAVALEIRAPDQPTREITLDAIPGREGWFGGRARFLTPGVTTLRLPLPGEVGVGEDAALSRAINVVQSDLELRALRMHEGRLRELARLAGGTYVPFDELETLPARIEKATQVNVARGVDSPLWDRTWVLLLIAGLLCVEWAVRRRNYLL